MTTDGEAFIEVLKHNETEAPNPNIRAPENIQASNLRSFIDSIKV
jgi:hypothetical protein